MTSAPRSSSGASEGVTRASWRISVSDPTVETGAYQYEVAGLLVESSWSLELPWRTESTRREARVSDERDRSAVEPGEAPGRQIWEGDGWLGGTWRQVRSSEMSGGCEIDVDGWGRAIVQPGSREIQIFPIGSVFESEPRLSMEVVLGPILALMLAYEGTFCLHAGSVTVDDRVLAFLGESGVGKSTLSASAGAEWVQLGDDILAVDGSGRSALPRFPQLKLQNQYSAEGPKSVELGSLFALAPFRTRAEAPEHGREISGDPQSVREATLTIVRHSVGAKLFPATLLGEHLAWCERVARSVPLLRWTYPHDLDRLEEVRAAIRATVRREA